jgi:hypothetical protein
VKAYLPCCGLTREREGRFVERFVSEQNVKHYRQLASGTLTAAERKSIFTALSEQEASFRKSTRLNFLAAEGPG